MRSYILLMLAAMLLVGCDKVMKRASCPPPPSIHVVCSAPTTQPALCPELVRVQPESESPSTIALKAINRYLIYVMRADKKTIVNWDEEPELVPFINEVQRDCLAKTYAALENKTITTVPDAAEAQRVCWSDTIKERGPASLKDVHVTLMDFGP